MPYFLTGCRKMKIIFTWPMHFSAGICNKTWCSSDKCCGTGQNDCWTCFKTKNKISIYKSKVQLTKSGSILFSTWNLFYFNFFDGVPSMITFLDVVLSLRSFHENMKILFSFPVASDLAATKILKNIYCSSNGTKSLTLLLFIHKANNEVFRVPPEVDKRWTHYKESEQKCLFVRLRPV